MMFRLKLVCQLIIMSNYKNKKLLSGSAIIVSVVIMAGIFIMAFASAYMVITSTSREIKISESLKAEQVVNSGIERFKHEIYSNSFDLSSADCNSDLFSLSGEDYSYVINCLDIGDDRKVYISATYKNKTIAKEILLPFICGFDTVLYEGYEYGTVRIGRQCWLSENLNVGSIVTSSAASPCIDVSGGGVWSCQNNNSQIEKYCYDNNSSDCIGYGGLYEWAEALNLPYECGYNVEFSDNLDGTYTGICNGSEYIIESKHQGICPEGWHIPSQSEFVDLISYLGVNAVDAVKSSSIDSPSWDGNNSSGLSIPPSGIRFAASSFSDKYSYTNIWTNSPSGTIFGLAYEVYVDLSSNFDNRHAGFSVRCLRD